MSGDRENRETRRHADHLPAALDGVNDFVTLVAALFAVKYTGVVSLHLLNGVPQQAEMGRPHVVRFPGPAASTSVSTKPLDSGGASPPSSRL